MSYKESLGLALQEGALDVVLTLVGAGTEDPVLCHETLRMLASLLSHRKFSLVFLEAGGLRWSALPRAPARRTAMRVAGDSTQYTAVRVAVRVAGDSTAAERVRNLRFGRRCWATLWRGVVWLGWRGPTPHCDTTPARPGTGAALRGLCASACACGRARHV